MRTLKAIIAVGVVVFGVYMSWLLLPPYFANYQLKDEMESEARLNSITSKSEDEIKTAIINKAQVEYGVRLQPEQLQVRRMRDEVAIWADYTVSVRTPFKVVRMHFTPATENKEKLFPPSD